MNEPQLDQFNQRLRANPGYVQFLQSLGVNTNVPAGQAWRLSDQQRKQAEAWVRQHVGDIGDLEIDISGNANQNEGFGKQLKRWGPIVGGGLVGAFGIPGLFTGLANSGGGAAASAAGSAGPASGGSLTSGLMSAVPANITSQGVSQGMGLGLGGMAGGLGTTAIEAAGTGMFGGAGETLGGGLAKGIGGGLKDFITDPTNIAGLGAMIASLVAGNRESGKYNEMQEQDAAQMRRIAGITEAQMRRTDPLHQVATQLAFGRMPTNYRQGVSLSPVKLPE